MLLRGYKKYYNMDKSRSSKQLAKFINYVLGNSPDEFGLVVDGEGYVKIKELIKAVCEEDGWRYIRRKHIDEMIFTMSDPPVEIQGNNIRAKCRDNLPKQAPLQKLPKLLYTAIRKKAYPFVLRKGVFPSGSTIVIIAANRLMAERIGKRIDNNPVILTVLVQKAVDQGVIFYQAGDLLYTTNHIPSDCFTGPPLPKSKPEPSHQDNRKKEVPVKAPGSFILDLKSEIKGEKDKRRKKKKDKSLREKEIKKARKQKQKYHNGF